MAQLIILVGYRLPCIFPLRNPGCYILEKCDTGGFERPRICSYLNFCHKVYCQFNSRQIRCGRPVPLSSAEAIVWNRLTVHEWNRLTYESYMKFQLGRETRTPPSPQETSCKRARNFMYCKPIPYNHLCGGERSSSVVQRLIEVGK